MLLNSRQFKFLKNYGNVNVKSSAKREYRDENVFLKGDRALSKLITLLISNKNIMGCEKMLRIKVVVFKKLYKFYIKHFLIGIIVFLIKIKNATLNSPEFQFLKNYMVHVEMYTENRARSASLVMRICSLRSIKP